MPAFYQRLTDKTLLLHKLSVQVQMVAVIKQQITTRKSSWYRLKLLLQYSQSNSVVYIVGRVDTIFLSTMVVCNEASRTLLESQLFWSTLVAILGSLSDFPYIASFVWSSTPKDTCKYAWLLCDRYHSHYVIWLHVSQSLSIVKAE